MKWFRGKTRPCSPISPRYLLLRRYGYSIHGFRKCNSLNTIASGKASARGVHSHRSSVVRRGCWLGPGCRTLCRSQSSRGTGMAETTGMAPPRRRKRLVSRLRVFSPILRWCIEEGLCPISPANAHRGETEATGLLSTWSVTG
jgi:hypothetical protein